MFLEDPILNAAKIISDSEAVLPIEEGRFVVGPMVKLGWGPAGLITATIAIELSTGSNLSLSCTAYHAPTCNRIQFGARLHLHAEACGAELNGKLSFDTLIIFSPFEFETDISGSISASYKGHRIASIHLSLDLFGPNPWHAKGKAKISVACFDCTPPPHR